MLTEAGQNGNSVLREDKCLMDRAQWLPVSELSLNSPVWLPLTYISEEGTSVVSIYSWTSRNTWMEGSLPLSKRSYLGVLNPEPVHLDYSGSLRDTVSSL